MSQSGAIVITTPAGSFTVIYNVNDVTTGVLCNFDDISPIGWGGSAATIDDDPAKFPGNKENSSNTNSAVWAIHGGIGKMNE